MKILHCIPNMAGGGAERQLTYLVKAQKDLGLDVHVILGNGGPNLQRLRDTGATVHFLTGAGNHDPLLLIRLYKITRRLNPDIIHTWLLQMDVLGGLVAVMHGVPFVLSERSSAAMYTGSFKWWLRELVAKKSAAIIANSSGGKEYWTSVLPNGHSTFVVPNAVPFSDIESAVPQEENFSGFGQNVPRILFVGRLSPEKQVDLLLDVFGTVNERVDSILLLCGKGEEESRLRARVEQDSRLQGRVIFLSYQTNVWGLMKSCQLFVSLSRYEGCPNAVMEAMACGLPLFLSDIPQHFEIAGENAWYVSNDPEDIADRLVLALQNKERNRCLKHAARDALRVYSPRDIALQVLRCYESVLKTS